VAFNVRPSIQKALNQLHLERSRIDKQIAALTEALSAFVGGVGRRARAASRTASPRRRRRKMTAAQRRAIAKRMKAFWAKRRAAKASK
jgi:hypothetical protein